MEASSTQCSRAVHCEFRTVGVDQIDDNGKANAVPLHTLVTAHASLQQAFDILGRNTGTIIFDRDRQPFAQGGGILFTVNAQQYT